MRPTSVAPISGAPNARVGVRATQRRPQLGEDMAKKAAAGNGDRSDPKQNKSLAIRMILKKMPAAKASAVADAVKAEFGHNVHQNMVYMVKTKSNMASDGRPRRRKSDPRATPMTTAASWVASIKLARELLKATGSVANATALLKALDG